MDIRNIRVHSLSDEEMDTRYGSHLRYNINDCFMTDNLKTDYHYYLQRENDFLHVSDGIINTAHNSILDNKKIKKISKKEFIKKLKLIIFDLKIYEYTINK